MRRDRDSRRDVRPTPPQRSDARPAELAICGVQACLALFRQRPQDMLRIFYRADRLRELKELLRWAAAQHLVYREVDDPQLRRITDSQHHEGVAIVARPRCWARFAPGACREGCWLALDEVTNPHNLGAILRSAAFFGSRGVLVGGLEPGTPVGAATMRAAEGGGEQLELLATPELAPALAELRARGMPVVGLETGCARSLDEAPLPSPGLLVLGNEGAGLSAAVRRSCTELRSIRGHGAVASLNVSVAAGVALAAWCRALGQP